MPEPKGALAELYAKSSAPPDEADAPLDGEDGGGAYDAAFASFAASAGIPAEKQETAKAALKQAIHACLDEGYDDKGV